MSALRSARPFRPAFWAAKSRTFSCCWMVTRLSLGIETMGGVLTRLIDRNTTIPTHKSQVFSTAADGQTQVEVHVLQGEREYGCLQQDAGPLQPDRYRSRTPRRAADRIALRYRCRTALLHVSAKDLGTGNEQKITITASSNLSEEDMKSGRRAMRRGTADEDIERTRRRSRPSTMRTLPLTEIEKTLKDLGDKVDPADKAKVEDAVAELRKAKGQRRCRSRHLRRRWKRPTRFPTKSSARSHQQQQAPQDGQPGAGATHPGPDANGNVETDYEVHDDK